MTLYFVTLENVKNFKEVIQDNKAKVTNVSITNNLDIEVIILKGQGVLDTTAETVENVLVENVVKENL